MKLLTVTLSLALAVFLISIESSQQTFLGRLKFRREKIQPASVYGLKLRTYTDEHNVTQELEIRKRYTMGIRQIDGINVIVGIYIDGKIRPVYDDMNRLVLYKFGNPLEEFVPRANQELPFGEAAEHTVDVIVDF